MSGRKSTDIRRVVCNTSEQWRASAKGSKCYLLWISGGHNCWLLNRTYSGRYVTRWVHISKLVRFRVVTLPKEHPMYDRLQNAMDETAWEAFKNEECD